MAIIEGFLLILLMTLLSSFIALFFVFPIYLGIKARGQKISFVKLWFTMLSYLLFITIIGSELRIPDISEMYFIGYYGLCLVIFCVGVVFYYDKKRFL